ncbi:hypothetical protein [Sporosarcina aquimarina]|uniref:hypothetical protein n=1 Tax=Sporosarcina aquimarina TaxID=114975 RepID=UPI001C8DF668|nr:hypothetical protein [Sporosarcina aquimarina]MBY0224102.1 hypothetical protein [Sporosarcina aquimarina]
MGKLIFVTNLSGIKEVKEDIADIVAKANAGDTAYQAVAMYIAQALEYVKDIDIPTGDNAYLLGWNAPHIWEPDRTLTFHIVKKAVSQPSVFEFRINWNPLYFRALFFVDDVDQEQYKFLVRSLMKDEKNPPELQQKINETELVAMMYKTNPSRYLKEWS